MSEKNPASLSEEEMKAIVSRETEKGASVALTDKIDNGAPMIRNMLIIGCGDGGCNIASAIRETISGSYAILYNTSMRAIENLACDLRVIPEGTDGAGKSRDLSKTLFKGGSYEVILNNVRTVVERADISYIVICATADGGTGSGMSPMLAKLISDNIDVPVFVVGVYPLRDEDAIAQYNAIEWQQEIEKTGVPYMVFDNEAAKSIVDKTMSKENEKRKKEIQRLINEQIVKNMELIAGKVFGNTNISMIDNRDMYMLISHIGQRMVSAVSSNRPTVGQSLDDYILNLLEQNMQPLPVNAKGIGIFVKGPAEFINRMDTSILKVRSVYGDAMAHYTHIEESDEVSVAIIMTGCSEASDRLYTMKNRYDDIMESQRNAASIAGDMKGAMSNPFGAPKKKRINADKPDMSALDF